MAYRYYVQSFPINVAGVDDLDQYLYYKHFQAYNQEYGTEVPSSFDEDSIPTIFITPIDIEISITVEEEFDRVKISLYDLPDGLFDAGEFYVNMIVQTLSDEVTESNVLPMMEMLKLILGDPDGIIFKPDRCLFMLNVGQDKMCDKIERHCLPELDTPQLAIDLDDEHEFDLDNLDVEIYDYDKGLSKKYDGVKVTGGRFASKISFYEHKQNINNNETYTTLEPKWYARGSIIHVEPGDQIDLYYMKKAADMVYVSPVSTNNVNCIFGKRKQKIIIGLACEDYLERTKQAKRCYESALIDIGDINESNPPTESNIFVDNAGLRDNSRVDSFPTIYYVPDV